MKIEIGKYVSNRIQAPVGVRESTLVCVRFMGKIFNSGCEEPNNKIVFLLLLPFY